jgi:hypothetical protein
MQCDRSLGIIIMLVALGLSGAWAQSTLPEPGTSKCTQLRFLSYPKTPKSLGDLMPQARAFAASKEGMGNLKRGDTVLPVPVTAEEMPLEAVRRALVERGVNVTILSENWIPEVPGINAPGSYKDYSRDPWKVAKSQMEEILGDSYSYYHPLGKTQK